MRALSGQSPSGWTLAEPPFYATSFDCRKAKVNSTEEGICKHEGLAKLDVDAAAAYRRRLAAASAQEKTQLVDSQRKWLVIRNSHNLNPYFGDPDGMVADLADFYKIRIAALRSSNAALLDTPIPKEYDWLRATAPEGFSKNEFSIGRGYASCQDPCQKKPSLYRWISIGGRGIGKEPGDINMPYAELLNTLAAKGWTKCREVTDDSGKERIDRFSRNEKMLSVSRYYSMGVGNSIGVSITISGPLPEVARQPTLNPTVTVTDDWDAYSSADVGLTVRFPPDWHVYDRSPTNAATKYKYLMFGADDYKPGEFRVTVEPVGVEDPNYVPPPDAPKCSPSPYRISGFTAKECLFEDELYTQGICTRYLQSIVVRAGNYDLTFEPAQTGSFPDESGHYKLTDLYEKIMSTIKFKPTN